MYTYAFLLNSGIPLDLPEGIWGSLELVKLNQLAALVEPELSFEVLQKSDRQLMQALLSHDRVIQEVFQQTVVLPLQFGTCFISRQGLLDHLQTHYVEYLDKLLHLQGKAEYVLKLLPLAFSDALISSESGIRDSALPQPRHYSDQIAWRQQQQTELRSLSSLISEFYPESVRGQITEEGVERIYLLHSRQAERQLQAQLANWQQRFRCWVFNLGETLPPYHFV